MRSLSSHRRFTTIATGLTAALALALGQPFPVLLPASHAASAAASVDDAQKLLEAVRARQLTVADVSFLVGCIREGQPEISTITFEGREAQLRLTTRPEKAAWLQKLAASFQIVAMPRFVTSGESPLQPGDLVLAPFSYEDPSSIGMIYSHDGQADKGQAVFFSEATGEMKRSDTWSLSLAPKDVENRPARPLIVLRQKDRNFVALLGSRPATPDAPRTLPQEQAWGTSDPLCIREKGTINDSCHQTISLDKRGILTVRQVGKVEEIGEAARSYEWTATGPVGQITGVSQVLEDLGKQWSIRLIGHAMINGQPTAWTYSPKEQEHRYLELNFDSAAKAEAARAYFIACIDTAPVGSNLSPETVTGSSPANAPAFEGASYSWGQFRAFLEKVVAAAGEGVAYDQAFGSLIVRTLPAKPGEMNYFEVKPFKLGTIQPGILHIPGVKRQLFLSLNARSGREASLRFLRETVAQAEQTLPGWQKATPQQDRCFFSSRDGRMFIEMGVDDSGMAYLQVNRKP